MDEDLKTLLIVVIVIAILIGIVVIPCWYGSKKEAQLFNQAYGTNYRTSDWFWAGETIRDYIHKGEQKQFNVNLREEDPVEITSVSLKIGEVQAAK